jgi:hypothetical protein
MSSLGLDPEVPLPPVDEDSDLVGKNNKLGKPDPGQGSAAPKTEAAAMPVVGGIAVPIPATAHAVEETDDEE